MSAVFEMPIKSETLAPDEIQEITGCARKGDQIEWLVSNSWEFHRNRAGEPIIGRMYARLRMAGITPAAMTTSGGWIPDLSNVR